MDDPGIGYINANRHLAERLLILLQSRRLLRDRANVEQYEHCRKSAHALRKVLESEMLLVRDGGFFLQALVDMQRACTSFVGAAGAKSENFKNDDALFQHALVSLREVFAERVAAIVEQFDMPTTDEIRAITALAR